MDGTIAAAVRLPCAAGGGDKPLLGDRVTSALDDDEGLDMDVDDGELLGVLSKVQHAYRRLLQSNNCFFTDHGTTAKYKIKLGLYTNTNTKSCRLVHGVQ